jgi:hypothetical protein
MKATNSLPRSMRDVVLRGIDLGEVRDTGEHRFTGARTSVKSGSFQTEGGVDFAGGEPAYEIPYVATFKFGKPRLASK